MASERDAHEALLDELFTALPEDFVATRNATVRQLQADDDGDAAAAVEHLRRPTLATWALNQVAHTSTATVHDYLAASRELRRAQEQGSAELRDVMRRYRDAQHALADRVVERAATRPGDPERVRAAVQETLEAAALDDAIAGALERGRLVSTTRSASAFDVLDVQAPARSATPRRERRIDERRVDRARDALSNAEHVLADARAALEHAERELEERRRAVADAEDATRVARQELVRVQRGEKRGRISG